MSSASNDACRAVSVLASTEDAKLLALRSVRAAITVALGGKDAPQLSTGVVQGIVAALTRILVPVLAQAGRGQAEGSQVAFSWLDTSLACAAEVAQVCGRFSLTAGAGHPDRQKDEIIFTCIAASVRRIWVSGSSAEHALIAVERNEES